MNLKGKILGPFVSGKIENEDERRTRKEGEEDRVEEREADEKFLTKEEKKIPACFLLLSGKR